MAQFVIFGTEKHQKQMFANGNNPSTMLYILSLFTHMHKDRTVEEIMLDDTLGLDVF